MSSPPSCQLVIPCYRDSVRLRPFLEELIERLPGAFTIQMVDDGSGTAAEQALVEVVRRGGEQARSDGARVAAPVLLGKNRGKGAAVRAGWMKGTGFDLLGFADADGAVSAVEIVRGYGYLCARLDWLDGILGSRLKVLGRRVERRFGRHFCGRVFATAVSEFSGLPVYDTQCGFKLFKASVLEPRLPLMQSDRFAFDVELILELTAARASLQEFPVDWTDQAGSKVSVLREMLPMLWDVWKASRRVRARGRAELAAAGER